MTEDDKDRYFRFLDCLRHTGVTNMWASPAWVQRQFDLTKEESFAVVSEWMETFSQTYSVRHPDKRV